MALNETVIKNIYKQIERLENEKHDIDHKLDVLYDSIDFEEQTLSSTATKEYKGRYFLDKKSGKKVLKIETFKKEHSYWCIIGRVFFIDEEQHTCYIDKAEKTILTTTFQPSIREAVNELEKKYTELSKEEFEKYREKMIRILKEN